MPWHQSVLAPSESWREAQFVCSKLADKIMTGPLYSLLHLLSTRISSVEGSYLVSPRVWVSVWVSVWVARSSRSQFPRDTDCSYHTESYFSWKIRVNPP